MCAPVEGVEALGAKCEEDGVGTVELVGVKEVADPDHYKQATSNRSIKNTQEPTAQDSGFSSCMLRLVCKVERPVVDNSVVGGEFVGGSGLAGVGDDVEGDLHGRPRGRRLRRPREVKKSSAVALNRRRRRPPSSGSYRDVPVSNDATR